MIFKQEIEVPSYLCDRNDKLHIWAAIRLCQEVTEHHGNLTGIGFNTLAEQNKAWVIARSLYKFHRRPDAFEKVMLTTWARGNDGLFAFRDYKVYGEKGDVVLTGTSYWPLIDLTTRRCMRLGSTIIGYEIHDELATDHAELKKLSVPKMDDSDLVISRTVGDSMLDHTQHVNNSEYIKLIFDALHVIGQEDDSPLTVELNFNHETRIGEELRVSAKRDDGHTWFEITNPRGLSVSAVVASI